MWIKTENEALCNLSLATTIKIRKPDTRSQLRDYLLIAVFDKQNEETLSSFGNEDAAKAALEEIFERLVSKVTTGNH